MSCAWKVRHAIGQQLPKCACYKVKLSNGMAANPALSSALGFDVGSLCRYPCDDVDLVPIRPQSHMADNHPRDGVEIDKRRVKMKVGIDGREGKKKDRRERRWR